MNKKSSQEIRKALLLRKIAHQRSGLSQQRQAWLETTAGFDKGWTTLFRYPKITAAALGLLTLYGLRHPKNVFRVSRLATSTWMASNVFRNNLFRK